ncbi:hypothetical protein [Streptomyces sp. RKAG290]|uniref:hypothetical protein n=1 Tax=Streptomyces sp. RKAG290 TaxID=2888348 RepID=UPI0020337128|nr:hypothetical protein [Streptomyces sp. RKAG290]MCM2416299.1 hypothetical protein [Streptomyces sp. RKAG290]
MNNDFRDTYPTKKQSAVLDLLVTEIAERTGRPGVGMRFGTGVRTPTHDRAIVCTGSWIDTSVHHRRR